MKVSARRMGVALERCLRSGKDWQPSLPAFMAFTKVLPDEVGAPDIERAFSEACRGAYPYNAWHKWSNACVYWAAVWTGMSDLNERPKASRPEFEKQYQKAIEFQYQSMIDGTDGLEDPPTAKLESRPDPIDEAADRESSLSIIESLKQGTFEDTGLTYIPGHGLMTKQEAERI